MPTQLEYNVARQRGREIDIKIYLLNFKFQKVDELSGVIIGEPIFNNDATNDIRRTLNISLYPKDSSFDIKYGNKIWVDKYVKVEMGIKDLTTDNMVWSNMGIYLINNPNRAYSAIDNVLTLDCVDLMAKLTGMRNGNIEDMDYVIPQNTDVRTAIIGVLKEGGFDRYEISECPILTPNEIRISSGGCLYDILRAIRDILPNYQMYFNVNGVFCYNLIPNGVNEQIRVDDNLWGKVFINYSVSSNFDKIKNSIIVKGKTHDIKNYGGDATISNNIYSITLANVTSLRDGLKIGFVAPSKVISPYLNVNNYGAKIIKDVYGNIPELEQANNVYYVVKYVQNGDYFLFMGQVTPRAIAEEINPDSPFSINGTMGKVRIVLQGGEYDNINMDSLALERAKWELYNYCKIPDAVIINCLPIYWLDVNWLVEITLPNKQRIKETNLYLIKQINTNGSVNGTQSITLMRYYPFYPSI